MIVPNHKKNNCCIYNTYVLIIIINIRMLLEKLCPIVEIFISKLYNNLKITNKVIVITVFLNKDTLK